MSQFNLQVLWRQILGKPSLRMGKGSTLAATAKILNASNSSDRICVGSNSRIEGELFVFAHGGQIRIGDWCFIGPSSRLWSACDLFIGNRVLISHNCNIMDSLTHPLDSKARHEQFRKILTSGHPREIDLGEQAVKINDDVWIGASATILRGVQIGHGAIVGAGSVVTRDVPPFTVVAGNPARVVRQLAHEN